MKISIVTTARNSASTLRDTIESVLSQTYEDWEHIIVDGASDDGTRELVESYSDRYGGRLIFLSEPDDGMYYAMNKGIRLASGDVVGILNSDDFYTSPDVLRRIADTFDRYHPDAVYGDIHYVDPGNLTRKVRYYSSRNFRLWKMRLGYMPAHPSFYCRKDLYDNIGMYDTAFSIAADFELLLRFLYIHGISARYIPMDFVTMRTNGASTSGLSSHRRILSDHLQAYRKNNVPSGILHEAIRYICKGVPAVMRAVRNRILR